MFAQSEAAFIMNVTTSHALDQQHGNMLEIIARECTSGKTPVKYE